MQFPLTSWDQIGPRNYIRQVYCFALGDSATLDVERLRQTLRRAIDLACAEYPDFGARVALASTPKGHLYLRHEDKNQAVLVVRTDTEYRHSYASLQREGFPAGAFVGPEFHLAHVLEPGGEGMPAVQIHARLIDGGLLLCVYIHHSVTDGIGMNRFVALLSQYTDPNRVSLRNGAARKKKAPCKRLDLEIPAELTTPLASLTHTELMKQCPEYFSVPDLSGPLAYRFGPIKVPFGDIPKRGCIFIFNDATVAMLKAAATSYSSSGSVGAAQPSTFACIVALTWIHATLARLRAQGKLTAMAKEAPETTCTANLPASWSRRAFPDFSDSNMGNAVCMTQLSMPLSELTLAAACLRGTDSSATQAFAAVVALVNSHLTSIDETYIAKRTSMIRSAPDPRSVGVNIDPLDPCDFIMNSWRHLGADTKWTLPGAGQGVHADAVRRIQTEWNMGAGLVMPGRYRNNAYEVLLTLEAESMRILRDDARWMGWVDGAVE